MKLNWGTGITIALILFMGFIVTLVVIVSNQSVELVAENYYDLEINYEDRIVATSNGHKFYDSIEVTQFNGNVFIQFPNQFTADNVTGQVHLYRANNVAMDVVMPLDEIKDHQLVIPESNVAKGKYNVQISWKKLDKNYFIDKSIIVE
jgi:hypothetical protein